MNEKWIWFSILVMVMKSLSSEEWEEHFKSKGSSPKKDLSLDPARLCKPGLQDTNLVKMYNSINLINLIIREMDISELSTALFVNSTDTIYVSSAQTLTETIANCEKDGEKYMVTSADTKFLAAVLKTAIVSKIIPKVMFAIKCDSLKAKTVDDNNIQAKGSCNAESPYAIYSATGLSLATPTSTVPALLCRKPSPVLSDNMKNFEAALDKELLVFESTLSILRTKLQKIFEVYIHSSELVFTQNNTATLEFTDLETTNCLQVKIFIGDPLRSHSLPIIVTTENIVAASQLLRSRLDESTEIMKKMNEIFDHILSPENPHTPMSVQYSINYFSDIFELLPIHSKEKMLSVILLSTIAFVLFISICFLSGYNVILRQGAREWIRRMIQFNTTIQVNPPPPPNTIPLLQR